MNTNFTGNDLLRDYYAKKKYDQEREAREQAIKSIQSKNVTANNETISDDVTLGQVMQYDNYKAKTDKFSDLNSTPIQQMEAGKLSNISDDELDERYKKAKENVSAAKKGALNKETTEGLTGLSDYLSTKKETKKAQKNLDIVEDEMNNRSIDKFNEDMNTTLKNMSNADYKLFNQLNNASLEKEFNSDDYNSYLADDQKQSISNKYDYLRATLKMKGYSDDQIDKYADYVQRDQDKTRTETMTNEIQGYFQGFNNSDSAGSKIAKGAKNVAAYGLGAFANAYVALSSGAQAIGEKNNTEEGTPVNTNSIRYAATNASNAFKTGVSNAIGDDTTGRKLGNMIAQGGIMASENVVRAQLGYAAASTVGDSLLATLTANGVEAAKAAKAAKTASKVVNQLVTLPGFSMNAYATSYQENINKGLTESKANETAIVNGVIEGLTEIISTDIGFDILDENADAITKETLKKFLKSTGFKVAAGTFSEGFEEFEGTWLESWADMYINGLNSDREQSIENYMATENVDRKTAEKMARRDVFMESCQAALEGAIGGLMGYGGMAYGGVKTAVSNAINYDRAAKTISQSETLTDKFKKLAENTKAKLSDKPTAKELKAVVKEVAGNTEGGYEEAFKERFVELGENETQAAADAEEVIKALSTASENVTEEENTERLNKFEANENLPKVYGEYVTGNSGSKIQGLDALSEVNRAQQQAKAAKINTKEAAKLSKKSVAVAQVTTPAGDSNIILDLESVGKNAKAKVYGTNETVNVSGLTFNDSTKENLYMVAANSPDVTYGNLFLNTYQGNGTPSDINDFQLATTVMYFAGQNGNLTFDEAMTANQRYTAKYYDQSDVLMQFYNAGTNNARQTKETRAKGTASTEKAAVNNHRSNKTNIVENLNKAVNARGGVEVSLTLEDTIDEGRKKAVANGKFEANLGDGLAMVTIAKYAGNSDVNEVLAFGHERISEFIKAYDPEGYKNLQKHILGFIESKKGSAYLAKKAKEYQGAYAEKVNRNSLGLAYDEYTNDLIAGLVLGDTEGIKAFEDYLNGTDITTEEKKSVWETIKDFISNLLDVIEDYLGQSHITQGARDFLNMEKEELTNIRSEIYAALDRANENYKNVDFGSVSDEKAYEAAVEEAPTVEQFSVENNVEQNDKLLAVHNLTAEQLLNTIKLGGFPAPSVAVIRMGMSHDLYGEISILFFKETIDPRLSKWNGISGGDAWTPVFPEIQYKVNNKVRKEALDTIRDLNNGNEDIFGYLALDEDNTEDELNRSGGELKNLRYYREAAVRLAYLKDTGKNVQLAMREKRLSRKYENEAVISIADYIGQDKVNELLDGEQYNYGKNHPNELDDIRNRLNAATAVKYQDLIKLNLDKYNETGKEIYQTRANNFRYMYDENNFGSYEMYDLFVSMRDYQQNGVPSVIDEYASKDIINAEIEKDEEAYYEWFKNLFNGIVEKEGIRNQKDPFTNSGTRRSWEALHDPATLENVVKAMQAQDRKGAAGFFAASAIQALATKDFKSIDDMKKSIGQLRMISDEEHEALSKDHSSRFTEIVSSIMNTKRDNQFMAFDEAADAIAETIKTKKTAAAIDRELRTYPGLNIQDDTAQKIVDLVHDIGEMPTGYFEAKPMRAVLFNEIAKIVLPSNSPTELFDFMDENNINYETYEEGDNEGRSAAINDENAMFSVNPTTLDDPADYFLNRFYATEKDFPEATEEELNNYNSDLNLLVNATLGKNVFKTLKELSNRRKYLDNGGKINPRYKSISNEKAALTRRANDIGRRISNACYDIVKNILPNPVGYKSNIEIFKKLNKRIFTGTYSPKSLEFLYTNGLKSTNSDIIFYDEIRNIDEDIFGQLAEYNKKYDSMDCFDVADSYNHSFVFEQIGPYSARLLFCTAMDPVHIAFEERALNERDNEAGSNIDEDINEYWTESIGNSDSDENAEYKGERGQDGTLYSEKQNSKEKPGNKKSGRNSRSNLNYSITPTKDSEGTLLTTGQQNFYTGVDPDVLDENGNLQAFFHGTPDADYTIFRPGTYFTTDKTYADRYQATNASDLGGRPKAGNNPGTYKVFLNIKKMFDTRRPEVRKIWDEQYYHKWDTGEIADSGVVDWTSVEGLKDFIEENELDFDGIIADEGADGGYGDEVKARGFSVIPLYSNQVKSVDNLNPTDADDYQYSVPVDGNMSIMTAPEYNFSNTIAFTGTDEEIEAAEAQEEKIIDWFRNIINNPTFTALSYDKEGLDGYRFHRYLTKSSRPNVEYQLTYFMEDFTPQMHEDFFPEDREKLYKKLKNEILFEDDRNIQVYNDALQYSVTPDLDAEERRLEVLKNALAGTNDEGEREQLREMITQQEIVVDSLKLNVDDSYNERVEKETRTAVDTTSLDALDQAIDDQIKANNEALKKAMEQAKKSGFDEKTIKAIAKDIVKENKSKYPVNELATDLQIIFGFIHDNVDVNYDDMMATVAGALKPVIEQRSEVDTVQKEDYDRLREYLKSAKIRLNDMQKAEVSNVYGDYTAFRLSNFGSMTFSDSGSYIDDIWPEIVTASGNRLDVATNSNEMPLALTDALNSMKPVKDATYQGDVDSAAYDLALEVFKRYLTETGRKIAYEDYTKDIIKINEGQKKFREQYRTQVKKRYEEALKEAKEAKATNIRQIMDDIDSLTEAEREALKTNDLISEAAIKLEKEKAENKLKMIRTQNEKKIAQLKTAQRVSKSRQAYRREGTELREQLRRNFNALNKMLSKPTENGHVPADMVRPLIDYMGAINLDTGKSKAFSEKLLKLSEVYNSYKADTKYGVDYDERTANEIISLAKMFEGKNYTDLTNKELRTVVEITRALVTQIRNANKLINNQKMQDTYTLARNAVDEIKSGKKHGNTPAGMILNKWLNAHLNGYREFRRLSGYKDDGAFMSLYNELDAGQMKMLSIQRDINQIFKDVLEGKENQKHVKELISTRPEDLVDVGLRDDDGKPVMVTKAMRLSLVMHTYSEANMAHVLGDGFVVPDMKLFAKGYIAEAYEQGRNYRFVPYDDYLSALQAGRTDVVDQLLKSGKDKVSHIEEELSPWEKAFLKDAKEMFWDYTGQVINETSYQLKGYGIAKVKKYFPINVDKNFVNTNWEGLIMNGTLEGMGMLNERTVSRKPIMLEDITKVILRQTNSVSKYGGLAIPIRDFSNAINATWHNNNGEDVSISKAIESQWGSTNEDYLKKLIQDLQGTNGEKSTFMDTLRSKFAGATLTLNPGVAIKQAASYPTAAAVVGYGPLAKALPNMSKGFTGKGIPELEKINPLLWYRNQGNSTQELGDIGKDSFESKLPGFLNWIQAMDSGTVRTLEYAAQYYVDANYKSIKKGSDEYWHKVSDIFTKVVEETQPNYTTLQQAGIIRTKNKLFKQYFMFLTQPMQNFGIVYDSLGELNAKIRDQKLGKATKEDIKAAKVKVANGLSSQIIAAAVFNAMSILASALLHKQYKWKDDNGEISEEEIVKSFFSGMIDTITGAILGGKELYKLIYNVLNTDETYYGLDISTLETINDIGEDLIKISKYRSQWSESITEADIDKNKGYFNKYVLDLMGTLGTFTGIPANNIANIFKSVYLYGEDIATGQPAGTSEIKYYDETSQTERIYQALLDGNTERYKSLRQQAINASDAVNPEDNLNKSLFSKIKTDYLAGDLSEDKAIKNLVKLGKSETEAKFYLAKAAYEKENGTTTGYSDNKELLNLYFTDREEFNSTFKQMVEDGADEENLIGNLKDKLKEGYVSGDIDSSKVTSMLKTYFGMDENEVYWKKKEWDYVKKNGSAEGYSQYSDLEKSIANSNTTQDILDEYLNHGFDNEQLANKIRDIYYAYMKENGNNSTVQNNVLNAYQRLGYNRSDKLKDIQRWTKKNL